MYQYFQPNKFDLKDKVGDCAVRAVCKAQDLEWLKAYDVMSAIARTVQSPFNCKFGFEWIMQTLGYEYFPVSNKKGGKRPTVMSFCKNNPRGTYILVLAHHYVCSKDGQYFDTWDSGSKCLYGYWMKKYIIDVDHLKIPDSDMYICLNSL